jgi:hypothetical protein
MVHPLGFGQAERHFGQKEWGLFLPPFPQKIDKAELSAPPPARTYLVDFPFQIPRPCSATWQVLETTPFQGFAQNQHH